MTSAFTPVSTSRVAGASASSMRAASTCSIVRPESSSVAICLVSRLNSAAERPRAHGRRARSRAATLSSAEGSRPCARSWMRAWRGVSACTTPDTVRPAAFRAWYWKSSTARLRALRRCAPLPGLREESRHLPHRAEARFTFAQLGGALIYRLFQPFVEQPHFQHVVDARFHFENIERLADEILRACLQRLQLVRWLGGDDEHRQVALRVDRLQAFHDLEAIEPGHLQVEENKVVAVLAMQPDHRSRI